MIESPLSSLGAKVVVVASSDENHPPENIIDGSSSFALLNPLEFLPCPWTVTMVTRTFFSISVKHLKIEKNTSQNASQFEPVTAKEFENTEGHLQSNTIPLIGSTATHLRFIITAGYDHFVSVHRVSIQN
ncbi:intraflagellar transport protein 25 homolog isoform X3 [Betta splendens]|uniref:Intraflagellar transport protein 25 homolog isoform X3 n=1 Tax=Betta splendens TaxID=158456 RepID=A0A8M1HJB4_BETSP|nr:intraflagellar transport protein 25 homolog isoform X3 [Betta splendens]